MTSGAGIPPPPGANIPPPVPTFVNRTYRFFLLLTRIPLPSKHDTIGEFKEKLHKRLKECALSIGLNQKAEEIKDAIKALQ